MTNGERRYLVSTAEDFFYRLGYTQSSVNTALSSVLMTAERRGIDLTQDELEDIGMEARNNYFSKKKTKGFLGHY